MQPSLVCKRSTPCTDALPHSAQTARRCSVGCTVLDGCLAYYLIGGTCGYSGTSRAPHDGAAGRVLGGYSLGTPVVPPGSLERAAAAARRRAARAVPSCAGAYVSGAAGSNACPAGSVRIVTEAACRTAATAAGKTVPSVFVVTDPYVPRGCHYASSSASVYDNYAYFNPHPVGAGDTTYRLLCAVTSGAPPPPPVHARTHVRAAALCMRTCGDRAFVACVAAVLRGTHGGLGTVRARG